MDQSPPPPTSNPRAFCQATGLIFQVVGAILMLVTCCGGSVFSMFVASPYLRPDAPATAPIAEPGPTWSMITVWVTFVGGLALTGVGIGIQHGRPRSGRYGVAVTLPATLFYLANVLEAIVGGDIGRILIAVALAILWAMLFLLAGHSAEVLRRHPAPEESSWTRADEDALRKSASRRPPDKTNR